MPVYSDQIGGMIAQQNQMFAGYGSYAAGFSPQGPMGMPAWGGPQSSFEEMPYTAGTKAMGAAHSIMPAAIGMGTLAGSMLLPGALGRAVGNLDPFQAALGGFGRASGITRGIAGQGIMDSIGTMGANIGKIGAGGFGNVMRAGITGLGGAAMAAALPMAGMAAISHAGGQMVEGAQYTQQVQRSLSNNFRFLNNQSATGFGFSREQSKDIADTMRQMGSKDIMSSPGEMLKLMEQGVQGGMFRAVQDAKAFKEKFKEMTKSLKEIAKTFNTTMEGAMPFLTEARRMGFWTPSDVMRLATPTQAAAINTGQSVAQVQAMQQQGAAMARQVGAQGTAGAAGITNTMSMVGGAVRSGVISERQLSELTGGLQGDQAVNAYAGQIQASSTRFAASRQARWLLAATANKDMTGLDAGKVGLLASGRIGVDRIRGMAEKNIQGRGAEFVMGEEEMRGDLLKMGVEGQAGFLKGIVGKHLYGESGMDKLISRKLIQRYTGGDAKQADAMKQMMLNLDQVKRDNMRRSEANADELSREQDRMMDDSYEGLKRKISKWWDTKVNEPFKQVGSDLNKRLGDAWEDLSNRVWGRAPRGLRNMGITGAGVSAMQASAGGDVRAMHRMFASEAEIGAEAQKLSTNASVRGGLSEAVKITRPVAEKQMQESLERLAGTMGVAGNASDANNLSTHMSAAGGTAGGAGGGVMFALATRSTSALAKYDSNDVSKLFLGDHAEEFKTALSYMRDSADGQASPEVRTASHAKAKSMFAALAKKTEKDDPSSSKQFAIFAGDNKEMDKNLAEAGDKAAVLNTLDAKKVIQRRMKDVDVAALSKLDEVKDKGGKSLGLGAAMKAVVEKGKAGELSQSAMSEQFSAIRKTMLKLGTDQEGRMKMATVTSIMEEAGMHLGAEAARGAEKLADVKHAFGKNGKLGDQLSVLGDIGASFGLPGDFFKADTVKDLRSKNKKIRDSAVANLASRKEGLSDEKQRAISVMSDAITGKDGEAALTGLTEEGNKRNDFRAIAGISRDEQKEKLDANRVGKKGTIEGVQDELVNQTIILKDIRAATQKGAGEVVIVNDTKNPKDSAIPDDLKRPEGK